MYDLVITWYTGKVDFFPCTSKYAAMISRRNMIKSFKSSIKYIGIIKR